jgi:hypothetical protein
MKNYGGIDSPNSIPQIMTPDDVPFAPPRLEPVSMQGMLQPPRVNDVDCGTAKWTRTRMLEVDLSRRT